MWKTWPKMYLGQSLGLVRFECDYSKYSGLVIIKKSSFYIWFKQWDILLIFVYLNNLLFIPYWKSKTKNKISYYVLSIQSLINVGKMSQLKY